MEAVTMNSAKLGVLKDEAGRTIRVSGVTISPGAVTYSGDGQVLSVGPQTVEFNLAGFMVLGPSWELKLTDGTCVNIMIETQLDGHVTALVSP